MKQHLVLVLLTCLLAGPATAATLVISDTVQLQFDIPNGWVMNQEPPQFLIDEMAEHIGHDAHAKGHYPGKKELLDLARKRFAENEGLLYNPQSRAFMTLDFSPLRQGEKAPSRKTIELSTRYAGESLRNEEGIANLSLSDKPFTINGAQHAHRLDAEYRQHDEPVKFFGIVGFSQPYWFYLYYTDYLTDPTDQAAAEELLRTIRIETLP